MRDLCDIRGALVVIAAAFLLLLGPASEALGCEFIHEFGGESPGRLSDPRNIAIDVTGNIWVAGTGNNRVQKFNPSGEFVSQFGVQGGVLGVAVDPEGDLWILGSSPRRIHQYKPNGELILSFGSEGTGNGQFVAPSDLEVDSAGNVWVLEGTDVIPEEAAKTRVQKFNSKGEYLSQFGKRGSENGQFKEPQALAVDSEGNVLVADTGNHRVQEFNSAGEFVRKYGSNGSGNGQFKFPRGIAVDSEGKVWVSDSGNHRLQRFSAKGAYLSQFGTWGPNSGQFVEPKGIAVSGTNVWVADTGNDRVQKLSCP